MPRQEPSSRYTVGVWTSPAGHRRAVVLDGQQPGHGHELWNASKEALDQAHDWAAMLCSGTGRYIHKDFTWQELRT